MASLPSLTTSQAQPEPKRPEPGGGEFFLKASEGSESRNDGRAKIAGGLTAAALFHLGPEERMVPVAAGIVADGGSNILRDGVETLQKVFKRFGLKIGVAIERLVQVGDVGAMVLVVMNFHGLGINVGFECVE